MEKEKCIEIAKAYSESNNVEFDTVLQNDKAYMFDNSKETYAGKLPFVVVKETGEIIGAWKYLNDNDLSFDDFTE